MQEYLMTSQEEQESIFVEDLESKLNLDLKILNKLKPNQYFVPITLPAEEKDTNLFFNYIKKLNKEDLEIDRKDDAKYGFKMPLAEKGEIKRKLIIFRRYE